MLHSVCLSVSIIDSPTVISHDIWPIGGEGAKGYKEEALIWQGVVVNCPTLGEIIDYPTNHKHWQNKTF